MRSVLKAGALLQMGLLLGSARAESQELSVPLTIVRNEARASFELPGGIGADVTISFEDVIGLHSRSIVLLVNIIDPTDPGLLDQLGALLTIPPPTSPLGIPLGPVTYLREITIPAAFPVILRIEATDSSQLSFSGIASVSIHTHNLELDRAVPLALFKSHDGGPFQDVMTTEGRGSYRAGGGGGDFSEFMIVVDRRAIDTVIEAKFAALQSLLTDHGGSMPPLVAEALQAKFNLAHSLYAAGATRLAILEMRLFSRYVGEHSGEQIPDVWRANCGSVNVAGRLRGAADTLRFSLDRKASR
jgi:hypothetical protein